MELHLGRYLATGEIVHHKDSNKQNNDISNLELLTNSQHSKKHAVHGTPLSFTCPHCGITFERRYTQRPSNKGYKLAFCSRSCNGTYYMAHKHKGS